MSKPEIKFEGTKVLAKWKQEYKLDPNDDGQAVASFSADISCEIDLLEVPDEVMDAVNKKKAA